MMKDNIALLHKGNYSCVISKGEETRSFCQRGVADLYDLYKQEPDFLNNAIVADKVVGKAAAVLMILGGVKQLYTDIISEAALSLFADSGIDVTYAEKVPFIENRTKTGWCPLESACYEIKLEQDIFSVIDGFISKMRTSAQ